ncbi:methionine-rich copper-binding protein CopC [Microbacterium sp. W4I4]|uniref:copper resistance CopC family protein n=1 Tax=Microbacterium sp. W4I4 TaxID=3042295 RepID=UPI00278574A2|nr:copper resistance CopC family protein [Microbacterium sp. W4I4]MDQ0614784.1 methionine-rich copper-binding protein CopC [Microbacterium sp. W4I4]
MFRIRTALAGAAVAVVAMLAVAAPASAHDELVSSSPAFDAQLTAAPEQVVLTFSGDLLALADDNNGTAMTVVDESGTDWVAGDPVINADTLTVPLKSGMPNGSFTVTWQVVSSDGHPTSGDYAFSLAGAAPSPTATTPAETTQPSSTPAAQAPTETEAAPWPLLIGLGVVLLVAIVLVIVISARKNSARKRRS